MKKIILSQKNSYYQTWSLKMKGISLCSDFYRQGLIVKENLVFSPQIDFFYSESSSEQY